MSSKKVLFICFIIWAIFSIAFFAGEYLGLAIPAIAKDASMSMLVIYLPVFLFSVLLLVYLTRKRENINWQEIYNVDHKTAAREARLAVGYLIVTQFLLGYVFEIGLHFPGPFTYETGSHTQMDVWLRAITYAIAYILVPVLWLHTRGFSRKKLISSLDRRRDIRIIIVYRCVDFFGPIFSGTDFLGLTVFQYLQSIPLGVFVNSLGAGLPVIIMMHVIFIPRIAVLFKGKFTVIALGGLYYALFSLFDQGVDYSTFDTVVTSVSYIIMTQTIIGMGKAAFTVVTGNPFIHYMTLHVLSARIPFDTKMYTEIFNIGPKN